MEDTAKKIDAHRRKKIRTQKDVENGRKIRKQGKDVIRKKIRQRKDVGIRKKTRKECRTREENKKIMLTTERKTDNDKRM